MHACDGKINAFEVWMGKSEGNGPLGRQGDNINVDLRELGWEDVSRIHL